MSDHISFEVTEKQRDILLQGLRFVRSSVMLEFHKPETEFDGERQRKKQEIEALADHLKGVAAPRETSSVS
jgi:hypothetical protein